MPNIIQRILGNDVTEPKAGKAEKTGKMGKTNRSKIAGVIDGNQIDDLIGHLKNLIEIARDARNKHLKWSDYESAMESALQLYSGEHYSVYSKSGELDSLGLTDPAVQYVSENHIFTVVKVIGGVWTANRPGFQWKAPDIQDIELIESADNISKAFDIYSQGMGIEDWYPSSVNNALIYGYSLAKLSHCFEKDASYGEERYELLDPLAIFFNPNAKEWDSAKYRGAVIVEERLKVKAQWENFLGFIGKPKKIDLSNYGSLNLGEAAHWDLAVKNQGQTAISDSDYIDKGLTYYIEYDDMTRVPVKTKESYTNPETGELQEREVEDEFATERKYPNGRLFVIFENDLIYDGPNPYEHGKSQFLYMPCIKLKSYLLGMGYPHLLWHIQRNINEAVTEIQLNANNTANPPKMFDKDELGDNYVLSNIAGASIAVSSKYMLSGQYPIKQIVYADNTGQAYNRYLELKTAMYQIVGIEEAVRGISKSGDSGTKVINLYQNATTRFRPDVTQAQCYLLRPFANNLMKNMIQFKINNPQYIGEDYENTLKGVNLYDSLQALKGRDIELQLKLIVGTATPDQRTFRAQETVMYKQLLPNSVPDEAVLINSDIPELVKLGMQMKQMREMQMRNQALLMQIVPAAAEMIPKMQEIIQTWEESEDIEGFKEGIAAIAGAIQLMQNQGAGNQTVTAAGA